MFEVKSRPRRPSDQVVMDMFCQSIFHCCRKLEISRDELQRRLGSGNRPAHSSFRYYLGKMIAEYLGKCTPVHAVYIYGSCTREEAGPQSDIDLIAVCGNENSVSPCIEALNRKLKKLFSEFTGREPGRLVNIKTVSPRSPEEDPGGFLFNPPILVWGEN